MVWWQQIAGVFGSLAVGIFIGLVALYVILRIQKKPWPFYPKRNRVTANEVPKSSISTIFKIKANPLKKRDESGIDAINVNPTTSLDDSLREALNKLKSARMAEWQMVKLSNNEQIVAKKPDALLEAEANLKIATMPWAGKLIPFQTTIWTSRQSEFNTVPVRLQQELVRAYGDMRLANDIVWLATVLGRQSEELDSGYRKLCTKVADRLTNIIPALRDSNGMTE